MWYGDGTFSIAPVHFYQLYTIHGILLGMLLPPCIALWQKKANQHTNYCLRHLKTWHVKKDIEVKVETIRTDFEEAAIKAATTL